MRNEVEQTKYPMGLPKKERLSGERRIARLFQEGEAGFVYPYRYVWRCTKDGGGADEVVGDRAEVAVMVSVSKRYHKRANKRNLLKRRTKEAYRLQKDKLYGKVLARGAVVEIALMYSTKDVVEYKKIENAVGKIIAEISSHL